MRWMLLPMLALGWVLSANPAPAERRFTPCPATSRAWEEARKRFEALDAKLIALPEEAEPREVLSELRALLGSRCFEMTRDEPYRPEEEIPALALKVWWQEGGQTWVESYLERGQTEARTVVRPPKVRPLLTKEAVSAGHRLAEHVCAWNDTDCGGETRAWQARLEQSIQRDHERALRSGPGRPPPDSRWPDCSTSAREKPRGWRYTAWRECLNNQHLPQWGLPLTRLRAPKDGWLVLQGRRGQLFPCEGVRAYHLGTGAAYISESCVGVVPTQGGQYETVHDGGSREPRDWLHAGTMAPEKVRELVWALLLSEEVRADHQVLRVLTVPEDFPVEWREKDTLEGVVGGIFGMVPGGNVCVDRQDWSWAPREGVVLEGDFPWPNSHHPGEALIATILGEAEATFTGGCPPLPPPLDAPGLSAERRSRGSAKLQERLQALRAWSPPPSCSPPSR